ncbi:inhibitor of nuclear factor kappa-B kinase subunit beta [Drosophila mojavensis]|uniref:inhibitor of nuclear factor kappa-B kinase subunit beta n=1 Tax=Drosophila mojavensis TaxID=7230 RepID=UPI001CD04CC0|nr:inhibitor of nuclear factor kappa-B kinase subunit beta [Drosophila mojavensis]XP_032587875.2 inhibitor of nuclear factor kappa-B kinase subunit beta [Drosophila mojavensis]XP_043864289.1 inhibitor of nuclear factor kappa-B kinase subunit beta [Drosophila mojavensis]
MPPNSLRFGDWELKGHLGKGGFGEVKHWKNRKTNQEIATKHIKHDIQDKISVDQQETMKNRWLQEWEWSRKFKKAFIVAGIELSNDSKAFIEYLNRNHVWRLPVIVLEYCNGGDVRKLLEKPQNANGLSEFEVREILFSLRQAIDFLHTNCRICHRDLKPDNIVIHHTGNGRKMFKLTDFGLARDSPEKTTQQSVVGTRHYYAPEVVDTGKYKETVDYWSMGVIAYEVATGVLPFIPHQTVVNIHINIKKKNRDCIAITEDFENPNRFLFHNDIPIGHHLSEPWLAKFIKWLRLALDNDHSRRGALTATDEVQDGVAGPAIFTQVDRMLQMKVLTVFVVSIYKLLEYELMPEMKMQELLKLIARDTKLEMSTFYFVLPTGHPHKRVTAETKPIDLYVDEWRDSSEESRNPPVMLYIVNVMEKQTFKPPVPNIPDGLKHFNNQRDIKLEKWLARRMILDMHYILSTEQTLAKMLLCGYKEYALSLEHDILECQPMIKALEREKDKCCGAIEQFHALITAAKEQNKFQLGNNQEWQSKLMSVIGKHSKIVKSIETIIHHYESILRIARKDAIMASEDIYNKIFKTDIYNIKTFQRMYIFADAITSTELQNIAIEFARARNAFLANEGIENVRMTINATHFRFTKIINVQNAMENLKTVQEELLQLQLEMLYPIHSPPIFQLNKAMDMMKIDCAYIQTPPSLDPFDSLTTDNIISQAMSISQLMEQEMDIEHS